MSQPEPQLMSPIRVFTNKLGFLAPCVMLSIAYLDRRYQSFVKILRQKQVETDLKIIQGLMTNGLKAYGT